MSDERKKTSIGMAMIAAMFTPIIEDARQLQRRDIRNRFQRAMLTRSNSGVPHQGNREMERRRKQLERLKAKQGG